MPHSMSFPHKESLRMLNELNIESEIEKNISVYSLDSYIKNTNLYIEVMGTFWHCDNRVYQTPLNEIQKKSIRRDKSKKACLFEKDLIILYLWEKDINESYECCKKLILEFIERNGKLNNYHSINYIIKNGKLKLRSEILIPFFER
jgi:hypothetical protein